LYGAAAADSGFADVRWGFIDSFANWNLLPSPIGDIRHPLPEAKTLRELSLMNAALQRLSTNGLSHTPSVWPALSEAVRAGLRVGLTDDDDLVWFAADRVRLQAPLERAHALSDLFKAISQGKGHYVRATGDYGETEWRNVVRSIPITATINGDAS
jgi:hypothetical protein